MSLRRLSLVLAIALSASAQHRLHAVGITTRGWTLGQPLLPSGLFVKAPSGEWKNRGHRHIYVTGAATLPSDPGAVYLAAGNGCIRLDPAKPGWQILTGADVTELRAISIGAGETLAFAHTTGIRISRDRGRTWTEIASPLPRRYMHTMLADRARARRFIAGAENGLWFTADDGQSWSPAGAAGFQIMHIAQSPHNPDLILAASERGGLFRSDDGGRTFENSGHFAVNRNLYDIAFDPTTASRIALCGWGVGVLVSEDGGASFQPRNASLPSHDVWSIAFDPDHPGRLYASVHEESVYVSDDAGRTWRPDGLPGTIIYRFSFLPAGGAQ